MKKFLASSVLLHACSNVSSFTAQEVETRPPYKGDVNTIDATAKNKDAVKIFRGQFKITVTSTANGTEICSGDFEGVLWSNQYFEPTGNMNCLLKGAVDLKESFPNLSSKAFEEYPEYGMIVRAENKSEADAPIFEPPRILGLAPVQDHDEFANYTYSEANSLSVFSSEDGFLTDEGSFTLTVEEFSGTKQIPSGETFDQVISYSLTTEGFNGVPGHLISREDRRQTWINTYPIALLEVKVQSTLSDKLPGLASTLGDLIFGPIVIHITLQASLPSSDEELIISAQ